MAPVAIAWGRLTPYTPVSVTGIRRRWHRYALSRHRRCDGQNCGPGGTCTHRVGEINAGAYRCECAVGFEGGGIGLPCSDIDECQGIICDNGGQCLQQVGEENAGAFNCLCATGYQGGGPNNTICLDINECDTINCGPGGTCRHQEGESIAGRFICECESGYAGGGPNTSCFDLDECTVNRGGCDPNAACINLRPLVSQPPAPASRLFWYRPSLQSWSPPCGPTSMKRRHPRTRTTESAHRLPSVARYVRTPPPTNTSNRECANYERCDGGESCWSTLQLAAQYARYAYVQDRQNTFVAPRVESLTRCRFWCHSPTKARTPRVRGNSASSQHHRPELKRFNERRRPISQHT